MKLNKFFPLILAAAITACTLSACGEPAENSAVSSVSSAAVIDDANDTNAFRPVDCGLQPQEIFSYPNMGLEFTLNSFVMDKLDSREIFARTDEDYTADGKISYALIGFYATTEEQRSEVVESIDIFAWTDSLEKLAVLGIYNTDEAQKLDELTGCDNHTKVGESTDGEYEYYLSTSSTGNSEYIAQLEATEIFITELHQPDLNAGETAFSVGRLDDVSTVGTFTTVDVFGNEITESIFAEHDLTLVNVFATWCSPCVREMPELEALRKSYEEKGISVGVVGVVTDTRYYNEIDTGAVERAQQLYETAGVNFPYIVPDETAMNGRLQGIESVPETFFVDKNGNIVSEAYVGARSQSAWEEIVEDELAKLGGAN